MASNRLKNRNPFKTPTWREVHSQFHPKRSAAPDSSNRDLEAAHPPENTQTSTLRSRSQPRRLADLEMGELHSDDDLYPTTEPSSNGTTSQSHSLNWLASHFPSFEDQAGFDLSSADNDDYHALPLPAALNQQHQLQHILPLHTHPSSSEVSLTPSEKSFLRPKSFLEFFAVYTAAFVNWVFDINFKSKGLYSIGRTRTTHDADFYWSREVITDVERGGEGQGNWTLRVRERQRESGTGSGGRGL